MKKILLAVAVLGVAASVQASYLFWQVTDTVVQNDDCLKSVVTEGGDYIAKLRYGTGDMKFENYNTAQITVDDVTYDLIGSVGKPKSMSTSDGGWTPVDLSVLDGDASAYYYYVEILKYDNNSYKTVAVSQQQSYADLSESGYIGSNLPVIEIPNLQMWGGTSYSVPEPTGGMLVLMGMAFLGLKRRRT